MKFTLTSPDGEEGYPGKLDVTVTYTLTDDNELRIDYKATTDKPTVINLTNHNYWNLGGAGSGDDSRTRADADCRQVPADRRHVDSDGRAGRREGTPLDFTEPHAIGERIGELKKEPHRRKGYDHCYVLRGQDGKLELAARSKDPASGRVMEVLHDRAGHSALLRQLPRRRRRRRRLQAARSVLPGDAALSRFAEPARVPHHGAQAGRDLSLDHGASLPRGEIVVGE